MDIASVVDDAALGEGGVVDVDCAVHDSVQFVVQVFDEYGIVGGVWATDHQQHEFDEGRLSLRMGRMVNGGSGNAE